MRRPLLSLVFGIALVSGTVACASPMPTDPEGPSWPEGREFWSTSITEDGAPKALVPGTRLTVRFGKPGELQANGGCNQLNVKANLEGDRIRPYEYTSTAMGCLDGRAEQDVWTSDFFSAGPLWTIVFDELTLRTERIEIRFTDKKVLDPDRQLAGPHWVVTTMISGQSASSALPDNAYLEFGSTGTVTGRTGCATLSGTYQIHGGSISMGSIERLERSCEGSYVDLAMKLDQAVMATLKGSVSFTIDGPRLTLRGPGGNGLQLTATP